jgi:hypothetical protein
MSYLLFAIPLHEASGDLGALVVLQEVAGLRQSIVGLARGSGDAVDGSLLCLARPRLPGSLLAHRVRNGFSNEVSPAQASAVVPGTSLMSEGNTRGPAM